MGNHFRMFVQTLLLVRMPPLALLSSFPVSNFSLLKTLCKVGQVCHKGLWLLLLSSFWGLSDLAMMINLWSSCLLITWKLSFQNNRCQTHRRKGVMASRLFPKPRKFVSVVSLIRFSAAFLPFPQRFCDLSFAFPVCFYYLIYNLILHMQEGSYYKSNSKAYVNMEK